MPGLRGDERSADEQRLRTVAQNMSPHTPGARTAASNDAQTDPPRDGRRHGNPRDEASHRDDGREQERIVVLRQGQPTRRPEEESGESDAVMRVITGP